MKQKLLRMRHAWYLLAACLTLLIPWGGAMQAAPSPQQTSVRVENVTSLKGLIQEIESQTSYRISYQGNLADNVPVKIAKSTKSVSQLLDEALRGTGITYIIRQNNIILTRAEAQSPASAAPAPAAPRKQHIAGQVLDAATRQPIIGATIWIKDSALGTSTASDGSFDYSFSGNFGFVTVSYVGYQTQEFPIGRIPKVISLSPDNNLEEVVVVGYGAQKKASIIGSIASVPVNDIKMPTGKISNNLAGQLAGVISVQRSGEPGASSTFWIRGISTFGSNKSPLVLVDGIERDLDLVDIEDIKEFSILKDAAATAVYGVRGANGVVLVTTRGGIVGKPQINIKFEAGMVQPTKIPDMIDAVQFAEMYNAAAGYDFYSKKDIQMFRDGSDPDLHPNIDWVDRLYKDYSFNQRVNVNISGGGSTAKYYISGGFYNEDGLFKADNMKEYNTSVFYRRFNFRSNVEVQLHKYTKLNVNLATTFERKNEPGSSATGANGIWGYALKTAANAFPDVYSNGYLAGPASGQGENPYALLTQTGYREIFYNTAQSLFVLTQDLGDWVTKGLTVSIKGSFDAKNENNLSRTKTSPQWLATGRNEAGELEFNLTKIGEENLTYKQTNKGYRSVYFEAVANWARTFGKHDLSAMFLFQQSQKNYVGESANNSEKALPYRHQGIAGRITYNYDNRYFVEGNFGYNGSENFSPNHRFGFFPSIALGYVVSNEKFFAPIRDVVSMVKLKASYGLVGNDQIGGDRRFIYNETVIGGGKYYFGTTPSQYTSVRLGEFPNPNVGWEKAKKLNLGADLSFFNQLNISVDYFKENREGIFLQRKSIPMYVGLSTKPWVNIGKMRNSGIDASLEYHQPLGKDLHLTVRSNFTYARNRIMDQDEPDYAYTYMNHSGQMQWQKFGLVAAGLFQDQEDIDSWAKQSFGEVKPGDIKYLDLNGDGIVDNYDTKPIGYSDIPEIVYGFGFSLQWKAFDLSAFFQGVAHVSFSTLTDQTQAFVGRNLKESSVFADLYGNTWTPENPGAKYPRMTTGAVDNNNQLSTFWMADGRYLRLKNLELGYTLPKRIANKIAMQNLRVYLSGVNLFTFSPFKLWDPDLQTGATNYPNNRIINLGLTIGF